MKTEISCDGCGACCQGQNLLPLCGSVADGKLLPAFLNLPLMRLLKRNIGGDDTPCVWLDAALARCKHYEHRPSICREFEMGGEACLRIRGKAGIVESNLTLTPAGHDERMT